MLIPYTYIQTQCIYICTHRCIYIPTITYLRFTSPFHLQVVIHLHPLDPPNLPYQPSMVLGLDEQPCSNEPRRKPGVPYFPLNPGYSNPLLPKQPFGW